MNFEAQPKSESFKDSLFGSDSLPMSKGTKTYATPPLHIRLAAVLPIQPTNNTHHDRKRQQEEEKQRKSVHNYLTRSPLFISENSYAPT